MGNQMPHQEKNTKGLHVTPMILLPIAGSIFGNKAPMKKPEHPTLDFHLEMIKKIDRLLDEHEQEDIVAPSFQQPPPIPHQPPSPIEPRSPIAKTFAHEEVTWRPPMEPVRTRTPTLPEEFKTELSVTPEFRFITSLEFLQTVTQTLPASSEERVEIIDINALTGETTTSHHTTSFLNIKNQDEKPPVPTRRKESIKKEEYQSKKVEVIDTQALEKETSEDTWITATQQAKQIEKKAKVYFLNKKDDTDKKQKNNASEQSYIPDDIEERLKALKEKKKKEEEQRRLLYEDVEGDLQAEEEKKEGEDKQIGEEKRGKGLLARQEKIEKTEQKNLDGNDPSSHGKDPSLYKTANELKKELKEQKRLHQLAIRKARVEERQRKKEERDALKLQKKQKPWEKEQEPPVKSEPAEQDSTNEAEEDLGEEEEEMEEDHLDELDEDIRKVLLMTDYLLGELPEDVLNIFLESEEFKLYEKVLSKYKIRVK